MLPYLGSPLTDSCKIWCVRVFHDVLLKYGQENAEMQKKKILMTSHLGTLYQGLPNLIKVHKLKDSTIK